MLQFGLMAIYQSGTFVVADTSLGIQIKYDGSHIAFILLLNATKVQSLWGNINGNEDDDLKKPEDEAVNVTMVGGGEFFSWKASVQMIVRRPPVLLF